MSDELPPTPTAFGGPEPSQIIDPSEFMWAGDQASTESGLRLLNTPVAEHRQIRPQTAYAIAAFEEVAKFRSPGSGSRAHWSASGAILADIDRFSPPQG
ncbi:hypothetical protein [Streptomyces puniciscabiei]|uniref:hypothetical protein n=1 Tax=Streptomyces puniciscabiei TaxID=164348 RepID=UPI0037A058B6